MAIILLNLPACHTRIRNSITRELTIGCNSMLLNARRIHRKDTGTQMILLSIEDVTDFKQADEPLWLSAAQGPAHARCLYSALGTTYLKAYDSIGEARKGFTQRFDRYNMRRRHQGLDNGTPDEVYWSTLPTVKEPM